MRLAFVGAVEGSYDALEALLEAGGNVVRVYTLASKYAHRHSDFADLHPLAQRFGVAVTEVNNINAPEVVAELQTLAPDYLLIIGWSQLLKPDLLQIPRLGTIGFHPALLPENRGRAAEPWVILRGLRRAGATLFFLDEGMDSGDIICQQEFEVAPDETARTLYDKVGAATRSMLHEITPGLMSGKLPRQPQDHQKATYTAKRTPRDGLIDWHQSAEQVWALIRAVSDPYPGAFTFYQGRRLIVWEANLATTSTYLGIPGQVLCREEHGMVVQCGHGHVRLKTVQEESQAMVLAVDYFTRIHDVLGLDLLDLHMRLQALETERN